jgi:methylmalonyl-CoA mutase
VTPATFPARSEADWRRAAEAALKGAAFEKLVSVTADGLTLGPLHGRAEGARALRAEGGPWKALARVDHPGADDFNAGAHEDLDNGADGLSLVFAGAGAAYGFGLARGREGALAKALDGLRLDGGRRFVLELGEPGDALAFAEHVGKTGAEAPDVAYGLDPLGARARGGVAYPLREAVAGLRDRGARGPLASADGRAVHDSGGSPAQELAFALASGVAYLRELEDPAALDFRLAADADQFATLAKFRAMRLLWRRVEEASGLDIRPIRLSASSAWRMMTVAEPYVNVMRAAMAAFAAGLGGADDVTLLPFTQALGLPDAFARRLARNTQLIELREARLGFVADPAAGAGGFEALTQGFCEKAWELFQSFEAAGGLAAALDKGLVQGAVAASAATLRRDIARAKAPLTGVSAHPFLDAEPVTVRPDVPAAVAAAPGGLAALRLSEPFERLRETAHGAKVFLAALGPLAAHTRRVGFARESFEAGGVVTIARTGAQDAASLVGAFRESGAEAACLCGSDEAYAEQGALCAAALKGAGARAVYLAGRPGEREAEWAAAGVDGYVYAGVDLVATLTGFLARTA